MKFGDLLRQRREGAGVKLRALARELGVSHSYLIAIEKNQTPASERVFQALVKRLKIPQEVALYELGRLSEAAMDRIENCPDFVALFNLIAARLDTRKVVLLTRHVREMK